MVSCLAFYAISSLLSSAFDKPTESFGGKHIIVAGDFAQLPPPGVGNMPLYSEHAQSSSSHQSVREQMNALGQALWRQFTTVVILRQNMRQRGMSVEDQRFRVALTNLRYKACTADDRALLRSRIVTSRDHHALQLPLLTNVSIITAWNAHRDAINEIGSETFSRYHGRKLVAFYSLDQWCSEKMSHSVRQAQRDCTQSIDPVRHNNVIAPDIQQIIWNLPPCLTDHHAGILRLCRGMPVLLKTNEATELCATNGAEAVVYDWYSVRSHTGVDVLETLFVKLVNPPKSVTLDGLPENVIPLNRTKVRIKCMLPMLDKPVYIDREQVMVLPNFAMTDFASQGRTRIVNICHLKYCRSAQSLYTCLSRSLSLTNTFILEGFDEAKTVGGLSSALKREF
ncbi:hypothetical protein C8Q70DRAFT_882161, partial [Cubamyces menziesii]